MYKTLNCKILGSDFLEQEELLTLIRPGGGGGGVEYTPPQRFTR